MKAKYITIFLYSVLAFSSTGVKAQESYEDIIIGLNQKYQYEKKALDNELNRKLTEIRASYEGKLIPVNTDYLNELYSLVVIFTEKHLSLARSSGITSDYQEKRRILLKEYKEESRALKTAKKEKVSPLSIEFKNDKVRIKQEHNLKLRAFNERKTSAQNRLNEKHNANKSELKLKYDSEYNKLKEKFKHSYSLINEKYHNITQAASIEYRQNSSAASSQEEKKLLQVIYQVKHNKASQLRNSETHIQQSKNKLEEKNLKDRQYTYTEALNTIHDIELNGGTTEEYAAMQNILSEFDIIYSLNIDITNTNQQSQPPTQTPNTFTQPEISSNNAYSIPFNTFPTGQCTWYVFGRVKEKQNITLSFSETSGRDAQKWPELLTPGRYEKISLPQAGAIAVWMIKSGDTPAQDLGHVAYIEKVEGNTVFFTEANNSIPEQYDGNIEQLERSIFEHGRAGGSGTLWEDFLGYYLPR